MVGDRPCQPEGVVAQLRAIGRRPEDHDAGGKRAVLRLKARVVEIGAPALFRPEHFAPIGVIDHAAHDLAVEHNADRDRAVLEAADKICRAVDGVDDEGQPARYRIFVAAGLLSDKVAALKRL